MGKNVTSLVGDSPLLPVVSADPIAPPGFRPRFPATHSVWDIFADLLWVTARNDTDDTDDTDTWVSYETRMDTLVVARKTPHASLYKPVEVKLTHRRPTEKFNSHALLLLFALVLNRVA